MVFVLFRRLTWTESLLLIWLAAVFFQCTDVQAKRKMRLISIDFEVFGHVQGVFFRKFTRQAAEKYSIVGWCKNTNHGTVAGQAQGQEENVNKMKHWLLHEGSPHSQIAKTEFKNEKEITKFEFEKFSVVH